MSLYNADLHLRTTQASGLAVDYRGVFLCSPSLKNLPSLSPYRFILVRWGRMRRTHVEIPCSTGITSLSQHFVSLTGDVWEEPGSWKGQCWAVWKWLYFQLHWLGQWSTDCEWAAVLCPPFLPSFSSCLPPAQVSRALQVIPCFSTLHPTSSHLPDLIPPKDPLLPTTRAPRKVTGRWAWLQPSLPQMLREAARPRAHVGVCLPGRGLPCSGWFNACITK